MRCWCVLQGRAVPPCVQRWTHRRQNEEEAAASPFRFKGEKCALHSPPVRTLSLQHTQKSHNSFFFLPLRRAARQAKKKGGGGRPYLFDAFLQNNFHFKLHPPTPPPRLASKRERERKSRTERKGEGGRRESFFSSSRRCHPPPPPPPSPFLRLLLLLLPLAYERRGGGVKNRDRQRDTGKDAD